MARTYLPSAMGKLVALWKTDLAKISTKVCTHVSYTTAHTGNIFLEFFCFSCAILAVLLNN